MADFLTFAITRMLRSLPPPPSQRRARAEEAARTATERLGERTQRLRSVEAAIVDAEASLARARAAQVRILPRIPLLSPGFVRSLHICPFP